MGLLWIAVQGVPSVLVTRKIANTLRGHVLLKSQKRSRIPCSPVGCGPEEPGEGMSALVSADVASTGDWSHPPWGWGIIQGAAVGVEQGLPTSFGHKCGQAGHRPCFHTWKNLLVQEKYMCTQAWYLMCFYFQLYITKKNLKYRKVVSIVHNTYSRSLSLDSTSAISWHFCLLSLAHLYLSK